jgi:RNase P protein component
MPVAVDLVVIAQTGAGVLGVAALRDELNALLERAAQ